MSFMPTSSAVDAARRIAQSALPDAPVVDETTERTVLGRKRRSARAARHAKPTAVAGKPAECC
jgi:hypothetical protein